MPRAWRRRPTSARSTPRTFLPSWAASKARGRGRRVITPIGPRPYDISFASNAAGEIEGAAEPGGAIHTWTFHRDGEDLKLRFLSTFRGNRQPVLLKARGARDSAVIFQALRPEFLSVRIRAETQTLVMRVFHGDRLHVEIRLHRR
ncbi:MAG: hypothetical protein MZW92_35985 [Comamonadaceae bacterium]|nr:hypothetical protein [Comamonadaceae bacterium]